WIPRSVGLQPIDWFASAPLTAVIIMVAWQWLPFATLILLTAIQSLDEEQREAAEMDGTPPLSFFFYIVLPHLARPITVVILIETIFLLNVFAKVYVTGTAGPAGNLPYLVYFQGLLNYDVGGASAGGIVAVVLANIVAFFLVRIVGRNLEGESEGTQGHDETHRHIHRGGVVVRIPDLPADPVDGADELQDRARGILD